MSRTGSGHMTLDLLKGKQIRADRWLLPARAVAYGEIATNTFVCAEKWIPLKDAIGYLRVLSDSLIPMGADWRAVQLVERYQKRLLERGMDSTWRTALLVDKLGKTHHVGDYSGRWTVIHYWGTWCASCVHAMDSVRALRLRLDTSVLVLNVSFEKDSKVWQAFVERHPVGATELWTPIDASFNDQTPFGAFGVRWVPAYIVVDPRGNVVRMFDNDPSVEQVVEFLGAVKGREE
jgi:hypothetical protein